MDIDRLCEVCAVIEQRPTPDTCEPQHNDGELVGFVWKWRDADPKRQLHIHVFFSPIKTAVERGERRIYAPLQNFDIRWQNTWGILGKSKKEFLLTYDNLSGNRPAPIEGLLEALRASSTIPLPLASA